MSELFVYTDGACKGNPGPGGWGFVVYLSKACEEEHHIIWGGKEYTTNNQMEMMAIIEALKYVIEHYSDRKITIYSDSNIAVKGINEWMNGWKRRGWRKADGSPVLNKELWIILDRLLCTTGLQVTFVKVAAHSGIRGNERADELANMAL